MLKSYECIGRKGEEALYHYMIFVTLSENILFVNEIIVHINLIKLTNNK